MILVLIRRYIALLAVVLISAGANAEMSDGGSGSGSAPKKGSSCIKILSSTGERSPGPHVFRPATESDFSLFAAVSQAKDAINRRSADLPNVRMSPSMSSFRKVVLPFYKLGEDYNELNTRLMEAQLRLSSLATRSQLVAKKGGDYDVVIEGGGIQGMIALVALLERQPNAKVLVVEGTNSIASTFRLLGDTININSSSRASREDRQPLPGEGNINEFPGGPVQLPDISPVRYPTASDKSKPYIIAAYAVLRNNPNVEFAFRTDIKKSSIEKDGTFKTYIKPKGLEGEEDLVINSKFKIGSTGLSNIVLSESIESSLKRNPELLVSRNGENSLPPVVTVQDFLRQLARHPDPKSLLENLDIAVAGTGDFGKTAVAYALDLAVARAYGLSDTQYRGPSEILWLGQDAKTCEEYQAEARTRYKDIGPLFRGKLQGGLGKLVSVTSDRRGKVGLELDDGSREKADVLVLATGIEGQLRKSLADLVDGDTDLSDLSEKEFLDKYFERIMGSTLTSGPTKTAIGISPVVDGQVEENYIIVGPAAGQLATPEELIGIVQNAVSVFNNAPRTRAGALSIAEKAGVLRRSKKPANGIAKTVFNLVEKPQVIEISGVQNTRLIGDLSERYLQEVVSNLIDEKSFSNSKIDSVDIYFNMDGDKLKVFAPTKIQAPMDGYVDIRDIIAQLNETSDFIATAQRIVMSVNAGFDKPEYSLRIKITKDAIKADLLKARGVVKNSEILPLEFTAEENLLGDLYREGLENKGKEGESVEEDEAVEAGSSGQLTDEKLRILKNKLVVKDGKLRARNPKDEKELSRELGRLESRELAVLRISLEERDGKPEVEAQDTRSEAQRRFDEIPTRAEVEGRRTNPQQSIDATVDGINSVLLSKQEQRKRRGAKSVGRRELPELGDLNKYFGYEESLGIRRDIVGVPSGATYISGDGIEKTGVRYNAKGEFSTEFASQRIFRDGGKVYLVNEGAISPLSEKNGSYTEDIEFPFDGELEQVIDDFFISPNGKVTATVFTDQQRTISPNVLVKKAKFKVVFTSISGDRIQTIEIAKELVNSNSKFALGNDSFYIVTPEGSFLRVSEIVLDEEALESKSVFADVGLADDATNFVNLSVSEDFSDKKNFSFVVSNTTGEVSLIIEDFADKFSLVNLTQNDVKALPQDGSGGSKGVSLLEPKVKEVRGSKAVVLFSQQPISNNSSDLDFRFVIYNGLGKVVKAFSISKQYASRRELNFLSLDKEIDSGESDLIAVDEERETLLLLIEGEVVAIKYGDSKGVSVYREGERGSKFSIGGLAGADYVQETGEVILIDSAGETSTVALKDLKRAK